MKLDHDSFPAEFRNGIKLLTSSQSALNSLILLAGLIFIVTGSWTPLHSTELIFVGILTLTTIGLTLANVLELLAGSFEVEGTFGLVDEVTEGKNSFLSGWLLFTGTSATTALLAFILGSNISHILSLPAGAVLPVSLAVMGSLALLHSLSFLPQKATFWPIVGFVLLIFLLVIFQARLNLEGISLTPANAYVSVPDLMQSVAILMITFLPFEAILTTRRQMRAATRKIPATLLAAFLGMILFLAAGLPLAAKARMHGPVCLGKILLGAGISQVGVSILIFVTLLLALNAAFQTTLRQFNVLCRHKLLPSSFQRIQAPFRIPVLLVAMVALIVMFMLLWPHPQELVYLAAGCFLLAMSAINIAAIRSRHLEPDRRRIFVIPLFPLFPLIALAMTLGLLAALPWTGITASLLSLGLGMLIYLFYGRKRAEAARSGISYFGPDRDRSRDKDRYRILVPVNPGQEKHIVLQLALSLARQLDATLFPLQVIPIPDPLAIEEGQLIAQKRNTLFQWSLRLAERAGVRSLPVTRLSRTVAEGILETAAEEACDLIFMPWSIRQPARGSRMGQVLDAVILGAQCALAVVTFHPRELDLPAATQETHAPEQDSATLNLKRIMVPTAGGPHAPLAIRIGLSLAKESDAGVSAVYVADPEATPAQLKSGQLRIQNTIDAIHKEADKLHALQQDRAHYEAIPIDSMVIRADDISEGIALAGEEFDLVLLGASEERLIDQALFGTIPEQVARNCSTPTIMVKHFRGLTRFWIQKIWNSVARILPALDSRERINVYKDLRRGARPDIDYFIMMGLSAIIATFGLLQNSSAVIIGAMLVAPLFTPILAFSLAIAQGETRLMRIAAEAAIKGITLALGLATIITAFAPMDILISEIMARAQPNMFDMFIALASGAAGAYAVARKDVAASLPGVAIAAALVPPISVIGIGLAKGNIAIAGGATLLFITNLVAIMLAGTITLLLLGFRPARRGPGDTNLYVGVLSSIIMLALIMIPLISLSNQTLTRYTTRLNIEKALTMSIASTPEIMLADYDIEITEQHAELEVSLYTEGSPGQDFADKLRQTLEDAAGIPVSIQIHAIPVNTIESLQTASGTDG